MRQGKVWVLAMTLVAMAAGTAVHGQMPFGPIVVPPHLTTPSTGDRLRPIPAPMMEPRPEIKGEATARGMARILEAAPEKPRSARKMALCIGIDGYDCPHYSKLSCCVADAKSLGEKFRQLGYDVLVMTDDAPERSLRPTYDNLDRQLYQFCTSADDPGDTLVITYAGHGDKLVGGQCVLLPLDFGVKPGQTRRFITSGALFDDLQHPDCRATKKMMILDACRSAAQSPERLMASGYRQAFAVSENLELLAGCDADQFSYEENGHGRLTQVILQGLEGAAYEKDRDFLTASRLCDYVQDEFRDRGWSQTQTPRIESSKSGKERFDLARRDAGKGQVNGEAGAAYEASLAKSQEAWKAKDYQGCVTFATQALRARGNQADALAMRAWGLESLGYRAEAKRDASAALAAEANHAIALQVLGLESYADGKHNDEALGLLEWADKLAAEPRWKLLAGGEPAAKRLLVMATLASTAGKHKEAIGYCTQIIAMKGTPPEQVGRALINRGYYYGQQGDILGAIADDTQAIDMKNLPASLTALALINRGWCYGIHYKPVSEMADYTRVIEMKGAAAEQVGKALYNRAWCHQALGDVDSAIADYSRSIELNGALDIQVIMSLVNRGVCYDKKGQWEKAITDETNATLMYGVPIEQEASALVNRALAYGHQGETAKEIADETFVIGMKDAPVQQVVNALMNRGWRHYCEGRLDAALEDSARGAGLDKNNADIRCNLGVTLVRLGKVEEAKKAYTEALALGRPGQAVIDDLVELRDKLKGPAETEAFLGWIRLEAGQQKEGRKDLEEYLKKNPQGKMAKDCSSRLQNSLEEQADIVAPEASTRP